jgi:CubicO group peptidase (beta-lactamase class C family)
MLVGRISADEVSDSIEAEMRGRQIPGAAVGANAGGRPVFSRGFGVDRVGGDNPVTPDHVFQVGSVSKTLTAVAVAILASSGRLELDTPISSYVRNLHPAVARLTLHQLLTHTSGLRDSVSYYGTADETALRRWILTWDGGQFFTEPGDVFSYSNPGYSLAGLIVQEVMGVPFADAMRVLLFEPLGMRDSSFRAAEAKRKLLVSGHVMERGQLTAVAVDAENAEYGPAGFLWSSVQDMNRFLTALVNGGRLENRQVLPSDTLVRLVSRPVSLPGTADQYGHGLHIARHEDATVYSHDGASVGFGARITLVPEMRWALVSLTNKYNERLAGTVDRVVRAVAGPRMAAAAQAVSADPESLDRYSGTYANGAAIIRIDRSGDRLVCRAADLTAPLTPSGVDRFTYMLPGHDAETQLVFVRNSDGVIKYVHSVGRSYRRQPLVER